MGALETECKAELAANDNVLLLLDLHELYMYIRIGWEVLALEYTDTRTHGHSPFQGCPL